jgi:N-acetylglucosamine-6-phosphate deacetylase
MSAPFAVRGNLLLGNRFSPGALVIEDGKIAAIQREPLDTSLPSRVIEVDYISPGFIDLQVNGGFGVEVGNDPAAIRHLSACLPATGVTAFLPTVVTAPDDFYQQAFAAFDAARDAQGARPLGLHLEGPLLALARKGAHRPEIIEAANPAILDQFAASGVTRLVTLASERPGVLPAIRRLRDAGIVVSLGHTDATIAQFLTGVDAGATMATHLYNAMSPFHHRDPGVIGGALVDDRVTVGLIPDGIHSHPASLQLAVRAKSPRRIAIVTDMMSAAGMAPGAYHLGGQEVIVDERSARLASGALAGSIILMDEAVRNLIRWTEATPAEAMMMASTVPAHVLGLKQAGKIIAGYRADLTLLAQDWSIVATIIGGEVVYQREGR